MPQFLAEYRVSEQITDSCYCLRKFQCFLPSIHINKSQVCEVVSNPLNFVFCIWF